MSKGDKKPAVAKISNLIEKSSLSPFFDVHNFKKKLGSTCLPAGRVDRLAARLFLHNH